MRTTEIPTDLLVEVVELVDWITDNRHPTGSNDDVMVMFTSQAMEELEPLIKWLEYIRATWRVEDERQQKRRLAADPFAFALAPTV
ncbi:hypothetical protein ABQE58_25005 [Mycolicibacterium elephantis]